MPRINPGGYIADELAARGQLQVEVAGLIGCSPQHLNDIIKGRRRITPRLALGLAGWLGTSAEVWLNLQNADDLARAKRELAGLKLLRIAEVRP